jgi:hypothetical protein
MKESYARKIHLFFTILKWCSIVCILISAVFLIYSYLYLSIVNLPSREGAIKKIVSQVISTASRFGNGSFAEDEIEINPPDEQIKIIVDEIIARLLSVENSPLSMIVPADKVAERVKEYGERWIKKGFSGEEVTRIIQRIRAQVQMHYPEYRFRIEWNWVKGRENELFTLLFTINHRQESKRIEPVTLPYPPFESKFIGRQKFLIAGRRIFGGIFALSLITLIVLRIQFSIMRKKTERELPEIIGRLQAYLKNGSYASAHELLTRTRFFLPENTDLKAIQDRLDAVIKIKGEERYKKAEELYNRFSNLKTKLEATGHLTEEEYEEITKLPECLELTEIRVFAGVCQKKLQHQKLIRSFNEKLAEINALCSGGQLEEAKSKLNELKRDPSYQEYQTAIKELSAGEHPALPSPQNIETTIEEKIKKSEENLEGGKRLIQIGRIKEGESLLREALEVNRGLKEAEEIIKKIEKSRKAETLILKPEKVGKEIHIFKKDTITFARADKEIPDVEISDPHISRNKHLRISIVQNKVIAEDMNSSGGTYIRGERIKKAEVMDGDIIDMAKAYKMIVHICRGKEIVQSTILPGTIPAGAQVEREYLTGQQKVSGVFIEADDRNIILLPPVESSVRIDFKPVGIIYEKGGTCSFTLKDGVLLLQTPEGSEIIYEGSEIDYKGVRYKIIRGK